MDPFHILRSSAAAALLVAITGHAQESFRVRAKVLSPESNPNPVTLVLMNEAGDTLVMKRTRSRGIHFKGHIGQWYILSFAQPGSLTKEVVVDARFSRIRIGQPPPLRFEVVMEEGDPATHMHYVRPVGTIRLLGHRKEVKHDYALERSAH